MKFSKLYHFWGGEKSNRCQNLLSILCGNGCYMLMGDTRCTNLVQCLCHLLLGHLQQTFVLIPTISEGEHSVNVEAVFALANSLPPLLGTGCLRPFVCLSTVVLQTLLFLCCLFLPENITHNMRAGVMNTETNYYNYTSEK